MSICSLCSQQMYLHPLLVVCQWWYWMKYSSRIYRISNSWHLLTVMQMYLTPLMEVCQWWHWMQQARSESLGADQYWDLVKWSLVTLCSTGEGEPPLTPLAQCLALVQPHTPSPTSILVQCMKWELHQWALLDWVHTAVGVGRKLLLMTVSDQQRFCSTNCLCIDRGSLLHMPELIANTVIGIVQFVPIFLHDLSYCIVGIVTKYCIPYRAHCLSKPHLFPQQVYLSLLL